MILQATKSVLGLLSNQPQQISANYSRCKPLLFHNLKQISRNYSQSSSTKGRSVLNATPKTPSTRKNNSNKIQDQSNSLSSSANVNKVHSLPFALDLQRSQLVNSQFYAQHRPLLGIESVSNKNKSLGSNINDSYSGLENVLESGSKGIKVQTATSVPVQPMYSAKSSFFMNIPEEAHIPEMMRSGPLADILFGREADAPNAVNRIEFSAEDRKDMAEDFLDHILMMESEYGGLKEFNEKSWSKRKAKSIARTLMTQSRVQRYYMDKQIDQWRKIDPNFVPSDYGQSQQQQQQGPVKEYRLTSILRKRKKKMNKHKQRKLRKRTRALRKRLGK